MSSSDLIETSSGFDDPTIYPDEEVEYRVCYFTESGQWVDNEYFDSFPAALTFANAKRYLGYLAKIECETKSITLCQPIRFNINE